MDIAYIYPWRRVRRGMQGAWAMGCTAHGMWGAWCIGGAGHEVYGMHKMQGAWGTEYGVCRGCTGWMVHRGHQKRGAQDVGCMGCRVQRSWGA